MLQCWTACRIICCICFAACLEVADVGSAWACCATHNVWRWNEVCRACDDAESRRRCGLPRSHHGWSLRNRLKAHILLFTEEAPYTNWLPDPRGAKTCELSNTTKRTTSTLMQKCFRTLVPIDNTLAGVATLLRTSSQIAGGVIGCGARNANPK